MERNIFKIGKELFITSKEEIKEADWAMFENENIVKADKNFIFNCDHEFDKFWRKVILTTDPQLIADGVQPIDDTFLEWFVKNPSCERVEVGYGVIRLTETDNKGYWISTPDTEFNMQIEEPNYNMKQEILSEMERLENKESKQETLEEAAESLYPFAFGGIGNAENDKKNHFIKGAKWHAERIENESELLINELESLVKDNSLGESYRAGITASIWRMKEWFEQFKKK